MKVSEQEQAQFDWLQERLKDPTFAGFAISDGSFITVPELRKVRSGEELKRLLPPGAYPIIPVDKSVDKSLGKSTEKM